MAHQEVILRQTGRILPEGKQLPQNGTPCGMIAISSSCSNV